MRYVNKTLAALLVLAIFYLGYTSISLRKDLFKVYDVDNKYAITSIDYDITIVDFNGYGCNHCQDLHPIMIEAIKRDGKVRYIPRVVSFDTGWDKTLAAAAYAAGEQGKFIEMHHLIYDKYPIKNMAELLKHVKNMGLDTKKFSRDLSKDEITAHIDENESFFGKWGLKRTPSLLMDKKAIYVPAENTPTVEELLEKFNLIRE